MENYVHGSIDTIPFAWYNLNKQILEGADIMAGFWDFLSTLVNSKKDKGNGSTIVKIKNDITGNNNRGSRIHNPNKNNIQKPKTSKPSNPSQLPQKPERDPITYKNIRLYSTGMKGKVYDCYKFYKAINRDFGVEVILGNTSAKTQTVNLSYFIYSDGIDTPVLKIYKNLKIDPHSTLPYSISVYEDTFSKMKNGKYTSSLKINKKKFKQGPFFIFNK